MIAGCYEGFVGVPVAESTPGPTDEFWYNPIGAANVYSGVRVTPESAMRLTAVMACVKVLAEGVASLPLHLYERVGDRKEKAVNHYLYDVLYRTPNRWQTSFEFHEMGISHLALRGNFYAEIVPGVNGSVAELIPLHPDRVKVERLLNGRLRYTYHNPHTFERRVYTQDEIFHVRGMSSDGMVGLSPIDAMASAVGLAMATERHGETFFGNGARPGLILEHPGRLDDKTANRIRTDWERIHKGPSNSHRTAVLDGGMKAHELGMTNEASQFLETRKMQTEEIARAFRVPLHMIQVLDRATYSNIEQQSLDFVQHTLRPWLIRWEQVIARDLITEPSRYFAEFNIGGLLRGDIATRYQTYATGITMGILSPNECREKENLNPREGGDTYLQQLNMGSSQDVTTDSTASAGTASAVVSSWVSDIAERLAVAEIRAIESRISKADQDRERFNQWAVDYYSLHHARVERSVAGLAELNQEFDPAQCASLVCDGCAEEISKMETESILDEWNGNRADQISLIISQYWESL